MVVILGNKNLNPTFSVFLFVTRNLNSVIFVEYFVEVSKRSESRLSPQWILWIDYCSHEDLCSKWHKLASKGLIHTIGKTFREGECVCVGGGGSQSREVWLVVSYSRRLKNLNLFMKVDLVNFEINRVQDTFILRWWNKGIFAKKK